MTNSVNTNISAQVALRNLSTVNRDLEQVQNRVSTGQKVASALDDGAGFAIAQGLRGDVQSLETVNQQLSVGIGLVNVTIEAATSISNTVNDIRNTLTKLADSNVTGDARAQYNLDFAAQLSEVANFISNSTFQGVGLLAAASTDVSIISNISGTSYTIGAQDLETTQAALLAAAPADAAAATDLIDGTATELDDIKLAVDNALNALAADSKRLNNQITFNTAVRDATESGLGAIVDADLARESARLQALQTKQQLAVQALGIANQAPQTLLGLFQ